MLEWLAGGGAGRGEGADPPETPAPMFAYKAFKNTLLGTPIEIDDERELTIPIKPLNTTYKRSDALIEKLEAARLGTADNDKSERPLAPPKEPPSMPSPTKSILLTPGTATARRKTVSFGDNVIDNERKRTIFNTSPKKDLLTGNISRQWPAPTSEASKRFKSKLTAASANAPGSAEDDVLFDIGEKTKAEPTKNTPQPDVAPVTLVAETEDDATTNLNEPQSQSGRFWKAEYESYRAKSDREIKRLIEYRKLVKSFAKKQEEQAGRLTDKLKQEEEKLKEMESRLADLAARMAGKIHEGDPKNEEMVKQLSQQTALTLKHKHKAATLRRDLERHGILDGDESSPDEESRQDVMEEKLRRVEAELDRARNQLKAQEKPQEKPGDYEKLQALAQKAQGLDAENLTLKEDLVKLKKHIASYEERRLSRESRLKNKKAALEARVKDYSERLRDSSKAHRESENLLQEKFETERQEMRATIASLNEKLATYRQNFALEEFDRSSARARNPRARDVDASMSILPDKTDEHSPPNIVRRRQNNIDLLASAKLLQSQRSRSVSPRKSIPKELYLSKAISPRPSLVYMEIDQNMKGAASRGLDTHSTEQKVPRNATSKSSDLNRHLSFVPNSMPASTAAAELRASSPARFEAAKARLQRGSDNSRTTRFQGKENMLTAR